MGGHGLESDSVQWQRRALSFIIVRSRTYGTSGIGNRPAPVEGKKDGGGRECTVHSDMLRLLREYIDHVCDLWH